jgi:hypothetical protein
MLISFKIGRIDDACYPRVRKIVSIPHLSEHLGVTLYNDLLKALLSG